MASGSVNVSCNSREEALHELFCLVHRPSIFFEDEDEEEDEDD